MSAFGKRDSAAEVYDSAFSPPVSRLAGIAATANRASVSAAVAAAEADKAAACLTPEIDRLIDELARIFALPVNVYQRETLAAAITKVIDARITATQSL